MPKKSRKQRFKEHMIRSKKLVNDFKRSGIKADMDKENGEITINMKSLQNYFENK